MLTKARNLSKVSQVGYIEQVTVISVRKTPTQDTLLDVVCNHVLLATIGLATFFLVATVGPTTSTAYTQSNSLISSTELNPTRNIDFTRLAEAIRRAEGIHSRHPYGILKKYKHTSARQACLNTLKKRYRLWLGQDQATRHTQPFIQYLGASYAPLGAKNDPTGLNFNWARNVSYFYERSL